MITARNLTATAKVVATIHRFRWLTYELIYRDLRLRYRGSVLGMAWTLFNPLIFMLIYTLVFSGYMRINVERYPLYLLSGLIPWTWFSSALLQGTSALVDGRHYVGKTTFPTELLILVPVLSNGVNLVLSLPLLFIFALVMGAHLGWSLLLLPVVIFVELVVVTAFVLLTATFNVFYRDLQQLVNYFVTAMFFLTPIFYQASAVPASLRSFVVLNPFAALLGAYQSILYAGTWPRPEALLFPLIFGLALFAVALHFFEEYRELFGEYV